LTLLLQISAALGGLTFLAGLITALAIWRKSKSEAKKIDVDAAAVLTDSAMKVLTSVEQRAEKLGRQLEATQEKLDETQDEMRAMRRHMGVLEDLLRARGVPIPEFQWPQRNGVH
jgi:chromosome segregation ATPase